MSVELVDKLTEFRCATHETFPYLSPYVYSLDPVETTEVPTMGVDKHGRIYWNPEWCATITLEQGAYTVLHEAWHLIARHCHRADSIIGKNPTAQERLNLNIAYDIIVWEMLEAIKDWCPEGAVTLPDAQKRWPEIKPNMTAEELYYIISDTEAKKDPGQGKGPVGQPGRTEKKGDGDGDAQDASGGDGGDSGNESEDGHGGGKPEPSASDNEGSGQGRGQGNPDQQGGSGQGEGEEVVDDHGFQPIGGGSAADNQEKDYELPADPNWEAFKEDQLLKSVEDKIEELEQDQHWRSGRGHIPAELKRIIKQKLRPQPNPWDSLRATVARCLANHRGAVDYTYQRPNRRQVGIPDMPRLKGPQKYSPKACVVIDTSGSMTSACLAKAIVVCKQGLTAIGQFPVITCDARVSGDRLLTAVNEDFELVGGGGTDMRIPIAHAESKYRPDVIVLVTDGDTPWPDEPTRAQLVVALTQETRAPKWATTVRIPDDPRKESLDD